MIVFVKPYNNECAIVRTFVKDDKVYIDEARLVSLETLKSSVVSFVGEDSTIDRVHYDGSLYIQDGFDLRLLTSAEIVMYKNKKNFDDRVLSEMGLVKLFIFRNTQSPEYSFFMDRFSSYQAQDKYNICVDILCDISKYYRIQKRLN